MPPKSTEVKAPAIKFDLENLILALDTFKKNKISFDIAVILRTLETTTTANLVWIPSQSSSNSYELRQFNPDVHPIGRELKEVFPDAEPMIKFSIIKAEGNWPNFFKHPDLVFAIDGSTITYTNGTITIRYLDVNDSEVTLIVPTNNIKTRDIDFINSHPWVMFNSQTISERRVFVNNLFLSYAQNSIKVFKSPALSTLFDTWRFTNYRSTSTAQLNWIYDEDLRIDEDGNYKETVATTTKSFINDYLKDQIRTRYGFFSRPQEGVMNQVVDSYFPKILYDHNFNMHTVRTSNELPSTACAISPMIAECLNVRRIPVEQLCRILGFDVSNIRRLLTATKARKLQLILAGVGGTGMNTLFWLTELCELVGIVNLFDSITIYESETIEYSNMLRFPMSLSNYTRTTSNLAYKTDLALPMANKLSRNAVYHHSRYLQRATIKPHEFSVMGTIRTSYDPDGKLLPPTVGPDTVIYGAPTIASRDDISSIGHFIAATHANTGCSLWLNPKQDQDIQVESYGMIQLGGFFMNQLRMAIAFLEVLSSDQNLDELDKQLFRFEFDGTHQLKADKTYHWNLVQNLNMMTEDEANQ